MKPPVLAGRSCRRTTEGIVGSSAFLALWAPGSIDMNYGVRGLHTSWLPLRPARLGSFQSVPRTIKSPLACDFET